MPQIGQRKNIFGMLFQCAVPPGLARLARQDDVETLTELLSVPNISQSIYTLPAQINHDSVAAFIDRHLDERARTWVIPL